MKNYDEFIKRLEQYEKTIDEFNSASDFDSIRLLNELKMYRARMIYFIKTNIKE